MRKFLMMLALVAASTQLGGCAGEMAKLQNAFTVLTQTTVTSPTALVIANSYDAVAAGATVYAVYCKTNLTTSVCSADNRRFVLKYVRLGRPVRNQIEGYITTQTTVPIALYNTLKNVVDNLNVSPAANFTAGASK